MRATRSAPNLSAVFNTPLCINRLVTDWICAGSGNSAAAVAVAATSFYGRFACRTRDACEGGTPISVGTPKGNRACK